MTTSASEERPAPGTLAHFKAFCRRLTLDNGQPFELEPFQERILEDFFDGCTETVALLPKGNGKTTLFAAVALYHLLTTPSAECYIAAASRDQAGIMLRHAAGFVRRSKALQKRVALKLGTREIRSRADDGFIKVLASDKDTADGVGPTLALVDELHRHKTPDLYGVFRDGLGKRDGQIVTISTAGDSEQTPLGELRANALKLPGLFREGRYTRARNEQRDFVLHEWALRATDDLQDLRVVKLANPARFVTLKSLQRRRDSPTTKPWQWARFACNVWLRGEHSAVSPIDWSECGRGGSKIPTGSAIYVGLDLAWKRKAGTADTTAAVPLWMPELSRAVVGRPQIVTPPQDGTATKVEEQLAAVEFFAQAGFEIRGVVMDPNAEGHLISQELAKRGYRVIEQSQQPEPMCLCAERLAALIVQRYLEHPEHPVLTEHVLSATAKWVGEKWRFEKGPAKEPNDAVIALAMAASVAIAELEAPPKRKLKMELIG